MKLNEKLEKEKVILDEISKSIKTKSCFRQNVPTFYQKANPLTGGPIKIKETN